MFFSVSEKCTVCKHPGEFSEINGHSAVENSLLVQKTKSLGSHSENQWKLN